MPQKFFTSNIESDFIKQLLNRTPVPIMGVAVEGRKVYGGFKYIYEGNIVECPYITEYNDGQTVVVQDGSGVVGSTAQLNIVDSAENAETDTFTSTVTYYDQRTHKRLGKYLRYYRDTTVIDLMPFYNCFNYDNFVDFHLVSDGYGYIDGADDAYKVLSVPIKMDRKYTIAVDCSTQVLMKPVFHSDFGMVKAKNLNIMSEKIKIKVGESAVPCVSYNSMSFGEPIVLSTELVESDGISLRECYDKERYLYLAIQLPKNNKSSVVVIEGDYSKNYDKVFDAQFSEHPMSKQEQNELMYKDLSLLLYSDGTSYAFADRLIEYLLLNAITSEETIDGNVEYTQRNIDAKTFSNYTQGIWNDNMRAALWYKYKNGVGAGVTDTQLVYPQLIKGGDFSSVSDWFAFVYGFSVSDNRGIINGAISDGAGYITNRNAMSLRIGGNYRLNITIYTTKATTNTQIRLTYSGGSFYIMQEGNLSVGKNTFSLDFVYGGSSASCSLRVFPNANAGLGVGETMILENAQLLDIDNGNVVWESAKADMIDINGFVDKDIENTFRKG